MTAISGLEDNDVAVVEAPPKGYAIPASRVRKLLALIPSSSGRSITTYSPLTGQALAQIPQTEPADIAAVFDRARVAAAKWAKTPVKQREKVLLRLHDLVVKRQTEIVDINCWETGKARPDAFEEVLHIALTARYYGRRSRRILATKPALGALPVLTKVQVNRVPKGVVGIISPWNYPFNMALCDGLAALAAGNAVVLKPDSLTALTALKGAQLLQQAGLPKDLWQVVAGSGSQLGPKLIAQADYMCFTGSTATGKIIAAGCAERLIGCSLELGGKNPMLVLHDADLAKAAEGAVRACFSNAGQMCVSIERIYIDRRRYEKFKTKLLTAVKAMKLDPKLGWKNDMGTLMSADQLAKASGHVADARSKGATVLIGGNPRPELGRYYFEPTVLEGVTPEMDCFADETFGPVISLYPFENEAEAIELANQGDLGLNASIYSRDLSRARRIAVELKSGTVNINEAYGATFASIDAPMGGMRESGLGRRQGPEGLLRFTETQSVASQQGLTFGPQFGMSNYRYTRILTAALKLLKALRRP